MSRTDSFSIFQASIHRSASGRNNASAYDFGSFELDSKGIVASVSMSAQSATNVELAICTGRDAGVLFVYKMDLSGKMLGLITGRVRSSCCIRKNAGITGVEW